MSQRTTRLINRSVCGGTVPSSRLRTPLSPKHSTNPLQEPQVQLQSNSTIDLYEIRASLNKTKIQRGDFLILIDLQTSIVRKLSGLGFGSTVGKASDFYKLDNCVKYS